MGLGVGSRGQMGGRVLKEPHDVPVNDDRDAHDWVGVINLEHSNGLGDPEGEVAEDAVVQEGWQAGPWRGDRVRQGGQEAGDEGGGGPRQRRIAGRWQLDVVLATAEVAGGGCSLVLGDGATLPAHSGAGV